MPENFDFTALGEEFWTWRAAQQPRSHDDIPRIERPTDWIPQWSANDVARYRTEIAEFADTLSQNFSFTEFDSGAAPSEWVDSCLLHSAISRVTWELDHLQIWRRQPGFYIDQTLGVVFDYLLPQKIDALTIANIRRILKSFKKTLANARANLVNCAHQEFAADAVEQLSAINVQLSEVGVNLLPYLSGEETAEFLAEVEVAGSELNSFREWLIVELPNFPAFEPIGELGFNWFLRNVALNPLTRGQLQDEPLVQFPNYLAQIRK